ncbi:MAG: hypothetical protein IKU10_00965 [Clostridia bacterium]|nr:hypothetical protein [Clostridia bacterium]
MKKLLSLLLVAGILLSVAAPASVFTYAEQNNSVTFSVSSADGSKGDIIPVPTDYGDIDGNEKVTAADALEILKAFVGKVQLGHLQ